MSYKKLTVTYSEKLPDNKKMGEIYSLFIEKDINPLKVSTVHHIGPGDLANATFEFLAMDKYVPTDEKLEKTLQELNLTDFKIIEE